MCEADSVKPDRQRQFPGIVRSHVHCRIGPHELIVELQWTSPFPKSSVLLRSWGEHGAKRESDIALTTRMRTHRFHEGVVAT
jgi:hypothetical protein